ncbi:sulfatase-like hydrolase/transferase [Crateriforma spongiae]|uniref:sulfatase-like hydrolase/transferase n=1 Tax=Crateriforma spongiae TaxID=2724528 RepID=UPI001444C667|nr:sulfatase-like hydrolase/transferase [Crateriforma spongiae]
MRFLFAAICIAVPLLVDSAHVNADDRPNVVVFLVDDMGMMDTSVPFITDGQGTPVRQPLNEYYRTPSMQRLAEQGIRLNNFYAMSVCSPTRISIMTGQNAARHRATNWINPQTDNRGTYGAPEWNWAGLTGDDVTLPGVMRAAGYRTIHVGKAHFGPENHVGAEPLNLGFDVNLAGAAFGAPGSYYGEKNYARGPDGRHHAVPHLDQYHGTDTFLSEALTIEAKKIISDTVESGEPFFLYFAHYAVHAPFESDPRFADHYTDSGKPKNAQAFATLIEGMDKSLGDMMDHFAELGIGENTLILFLGDNGSDAPLGHQHEVACAAPLRGKKGAHYEGGMRVPFIASWCTPDADNPLQQSLPIPPDTISSQIANVTDLFPTVLQAAGIDPPAEHTVDGQPLQTILTGKQDPNHSQQFLMHYPHGVHRSNYFTVLRDGDWKAIYHALPGEPSKGKLSQSNGQHYQLFNLASDPYEQNDLSKAKPDVLRRMIAQMQQQLESHNAVYPIDDDGNPLPPQLP